MSTIDKSQAVLKKIPSVDSILLHFKDSLSSAPYNLYVSTIRKVLNTIRSEIKSDKKIIDIKDYTYNQVSIAINSISTKNLQQVINGTGIILHTGLGRAPLSKELVEDALNNVMHYSNLELDIHSGKRGERNVHVESLLTSITGSESALVVNNNAAAVFLMLNSLAEGKEVIISRGEQVEIGGSFRIPDVIQKSGCHMIEVGTTNKTHLSDYENAISDNTGAILVAHTSNYKVVGFTESVDLVDLSRLSKKRRIPLLVDLGCGIIVDYNKMGLPSEPIANSYLKAGAGVISFSGDKLLGGPQAGILCGEKKLIKRIHKNPLYRTVRSNKITFSLLESILRTYLSPTQIQDQNLSFNLLKRGQDELIEIGVGIIKKLSPEIVKKYGLEIIKTEVEAGSGSLPLEKLPSAAFQFSNKIKATKLSQKFRSAETPVLGFIKGKTFYIDLKAIPPEKEDTFILILNKILS